MFQPSPTQSSNGTLVDPVKMITSTPSQGNSLPGSSPFSDCSSLQNPVKTVPDLVEAFEKLTSTGVPGPAPAPSTRATLSQKYPQPSLDETVIEDYSSSDDESSPDQSADYIVSIQTQYITLMLTF